MAELPEGTVTFLLTDVEGSTPLWEQAPESMRLAVARHDDLFEWAVRNHGGIHIRPRGEGDSRFAVFASAGDAVAAALAIQRAFAAEPWPTPRPIKVRIGLHTGEAELRDGDYYGSAVNRCARIRGIGEGGQILLSEATASLVRDGLPAGVSLLDHGEQTLKGLTRAERIFQLVSPDLPAGTPPVQTPVAHPHNLPLQLTRFIGREPEMAAVRGLLESERLVTLTGTGGAGKTRLALQVAADALDGYADGTWFVELAAIADPLLVPRVVASAVGVREQHGRPIVDTLVDQLAPRTTLLVLDNCEHLIDACARLAAVLLAGCPRLTILATSREPLLIGGEIVWSVQALSFPDSADDGESDALTTFEAVRLFLDRAASANPRFALNAATAPAVAAICRRLEGIPLAIELAAARLQALTVQQINERLDDRFRLLTGRGRTGLPHHQTLLATVDWSYALLAEPEQVVLRRLAVFAGGFRLDTAEQVCGDGDLLSAEVLDSLSQLVTKSLVLLEAEADQGRYRLLETIREYALGKLREAGEEAALRHRHLGWCIEFAEQVEPMLSGPDQERWLDRLHAELDNFRAAFGWSIEGGEPEGTLRLASTLLPFWVVRADWSEGRQWVERALRLPGEVSPAVRMKGLRAAAELADVLSDYAGSIASYEESLAIARRLEDRRGIANALFGLAHEALRVGDLAARRPLLEESAAIFRDLGDEPSIARSLGGLAELEENYPAARSLWEQNLAIRRKLGNREGVAWTVLQVGDAAQGQGDYRAAQAAYDEVLSIGRGLGYKRMIVRGMTQLAELSRDRAPERRRGQPPWAGRGVQAGRRLSGG
jgi:predicted ATPase/class 3 adenylate cyclase